MLKVMVVDDELPALKMANSVLRMFDDVNMCGMFSEPEELLESLQANPVDIVLVDMKMPGMHGLELAGRIQELRPEVFIVFVTAYDDYAVDAFETEALDYIMKPITADRMKKTLERHKNRVSAQKKEDELIRIIVKSFGRFSVENDHGDIMKFRTAKVEELLAFLLHHGGDAISKETIMSKLWYDRDAERAQAMLYTTIYQLRKDLENFGLSNVLLNSRKEGGVCRLAWLPDVWDYAKYTDGYKGFKAGKVSNEDLKNLVQLHKGGYLLENGYNWAEDKRNELEGQCAELLEEISDYEVQMHHYESAIQYLKRWSELSPYNEHVHMKFIAVLILMNRKDEATAYYKKTKGMFSDELGTTLQINIETLLQNPSQAFQKHS